MSTAYDTYFEQAGDTYGVSPALLSAVAYEESRYNPNAKSPAGAEGIMQLMPSTAAGLGVADPFNPVQAINGAAKLLAQLLSRYKGNVSDALAAYNAGPGAVDAAGGVPNIPETQNYVKDIEARLSQTASAITTTAASLLATAAKYLGVPYEYGGSTPAGFDCSGFVQYVLEAVGISVPRTSEDQAKIGQSITAGQAAPGDLVFFSDDGSDWSHVGIYLGAGQMIDAPNSTSVVRTEPVAGFAPYTQYRRVIPGNSNATDATLAAASGSTNAQLVGHWWNPASWPSDIANALGAATDAILSGVDNDVKKVINWGIKGVFVIGGVGLFVLGLAMAAKTPVEHAVQALPMPSPAAPGGGPAAAGGAPKGAGSGAPAAAEIPRSPDGNENPMSLRDEMPRHHHKPERANVSDVAAILAMMDGHYAQLLQHLHDLHWNDVLVSETATLDASGQYSRTFQVPFAAVAVVNLGSTPITIAAATPQGSAPSGGAGVHVLGAGKGASYALRDTALTIYGSPGQQVSVQVFTKPQPVNFGSGANGQTALTGTANSANDTVAGAAGLPAMQALGYALNGSNTWDRLRTLTGITTVGGPGRLSVHPGLPPFKSLNAVTATGAGFPADFGVAHSKFSLQTVITGAPTAVSVALEGSLDGANWSPLVTTTSTTGEIVAIADKPVRFVRANLTTLTGGAAPTVTAWIGTGA